MASAARPTSGSPATPPPTPDALTPQSGASEPDPASPAVVPEMTPTATDLPATTVQLAAAEALATPSPSAADEAETTDTPTIEPSSPAETTTAGTTSSGASVASVATPTIEATPTPYFGQVSEEQGLFVTTRSQGSKYYYARDDNGWHRIHPENQVWFLTTSDLLRSFPDRVLHLVHTATATRTPTATKTPTATRTPTPSQ